MSAPIATEPLYQDTGHCSEPPLQRQTTPTHRDHHGPTGAPRVDGCGGAGRRHHGTVGFPVDPAARHRAPIGRRSAARSGGPRLNPPTGARPGALRHRRLRCRDHPVRGWAQPRVVPPETARGRHPPPDHVGRAGDAGWRRRAGLAGARLALESRDPVRRAGGRDRSHRRPTAVARHAAATAAQDDPRGRGRPDRPDRRAACRVHPAAGDRPDCDNAGLPDRRRRGQHWVRVAGGSGGWIPGRRRAPLSSARRARVCERLHAGQRRAAVRGVRHADGTERSGWR